MLVIFCHFPVIARQSLQEFSICLFAEVLHNFRQSTQIHTCILRPISLELQLGSGSLVLQPVVWIHVAASFASLENDNEFVYTYFTLFTHFVNTLNRYATFAVDIGAEPLFNPENDNAPRT